MNTQPDDLTDVSLDACAEALFEADKRMWLSGPNFSDLHEVDKMRCRMMARAVLAISQAAQLVTKQFDPGANPAKFFAYAPEMGFVLLDSEAEACKCSIENLRYLREDANETGEWADDEAEKVCYGVVTHQSVAKSFGPDDNGRECFDYELHELTHARRAPSQEKQTEPVYWEWRHLSTHPDTVDFGQWSEWKRVERRSALHTVEDALAEFRAYIAQGYKYELRALYARTE